MSTESTGGSRDLEDEYVALWTSGKSPIDIFAFLAKKGITDQATVLKIVLADQSLRSKTDAPLTVEQYLAGIRNLADDVKNLADDVKALKALVLGEFCALLRNHANPSAEEFLSRFPKLESSFEDVLKKLARDRHTLASTQKMPSDFENDTFDEEFIVPTEAQELPKSIGRYKVVEVLGQGRFGIVYLARDEDLGRLVAVKVPHRYWIDSEEAVAAFQAEARAVARLDHPHIIPVYDVATTDEGTPYVVSKFIEGMNLSRRMEAPQLSREEAVQWVIDIAGALHHAHSCRCVHRDVKPANLLIDKSGDAYLGDFGLALFEEQQRAHAGQLAGSPAYMSPEQVRTEVHRFDGRTDIWSLGVVLYELLTGRRPFSGRNEAEIYDEILNRDPRPPRMDDDSIPIPLERATLKCLEKLPNNRFNTASDLATALREWQQTEVPQPGPAPRPVPASQPVPAVEAPAAPERAIIFRRQAALLVVSIALIATVFYLLSKPAPNSEGRASTPEKSGRGIANRNPIDVDAGPLSGEMKIRIWDPVEKDRRGLAITEPSALPLRTGDQIRIEAKASSPCYLYLIWVSPDGKVDPVFPWKQGSWLQRPDKERKLTGFSLPSELDSGWPVEGPAGIETLVLLGREKPLSRDFDLPKLISGLPPQTQPYTSAALRIDSQIIASNMRSASLSHAQEIDDFVLERHQFLSEKLSPIFALVRIVSFPNRGE